MPTVTDADRELARMLSANDGSPELAKVYGELKEANPSQDCNTCYEEAVARLIATHRVTCEAVLREWIEEAAGELLGWKFTLSKGSRGHARISTLLEQKP